MAQTMLRRPGAEPPEVHKQPNRTQPWPLRFYATAVGKKWVMAVTGIGLIGFVVAHLVGNLKIFLGREELDHYAEGLRSLLYPILPHQSVLWLMRVGLMAMLMVHLHAALTLTAMNRRARPVKYESPRDYAAANFASRTMRWSGVIVLCYVAFHLFDLTLTGTPGGGFAAGHVYDNVVGSLSRWWATMFYVVANVLLAIHLYHGTWSLFQSLGLNNPKYNPIRRGIAIAVAGFIGVGNTVIPVAVLIGVVS